MITEGKITDFFCIAYDFCKVFDAQMTKYTVKAEKKRNSIMKKVCRHMRHLFPKVIFI